MRLPILLLTAACLSGCESKTAEAGSDAFSGTDSAVVSGIDVAGIPTSGSEYTPVAYGDGYSAPDADDDEDSTNLPVQDDDRRSFDEDEARSNAEQEVGNENYRSIGRPYGCTDDCSGHEAGFKYRTRYGYGGRIAGDYDARSFRQGQQAFDDEVDRRVDEARTEYDAAEE